MQQKRYCVREADVKAYSPANHAETVNRRLIGPETVGAKHLEVLVGTVGAIGSGALAHMHPGIEQVCYMLEGRACVEVDGQTFEIGPGECCFFPADMPHVFTRVSKETLRVLVIYSPPYVESKEKGISV
jgi:mannose-6-phosphate isomerase-like protein (cupin superfamily)